MIGQIRTTIPGRTPEKNCWEFVRCGREPGGANVRTLGVCPAATAERLTGVNRGTNGGRACWAVPEERPMGILERPRPGHWKLVLCLKCPFHRTVESEEGEAFAAVKEELGRF